MNRLYRRILREQKKPAAADVPNERPCPASR
jgi:hypothetical protein